MWIHQLLGSSSCKLGLFKLQTKTGLGASSFAFSPPQDQVFLSCFCQVKIDQSQVLVATHLESPTQTALIWSACKCHHKNFFLSRDKCKLSVDKLFTLEFTILHLSTRVCPRRPLASSRLVDDLPPECKWPRHLYRRGRGPGTCSIFHGGVGSLTPDRRTDQLNQLLLTAAYGTSPGQQ